MRHPLLLLVLLLVGCGGCRVTSGPVPAEGLDPNLMASSACSRAEKNLLTLACKDSEGRLLGGPNKLNETFANICQNAVANHVNINPTCIAAAKSCQEVTSCPR